MTQEYFGPLGDQGLIRDFEQQWIQAQTISAQKLISGSIQVGVEIGSANYVAGTSGWQIDGDGNAEFNDVTVRGDILGSWDGADPVDLSSIDTTATTGFALDSSVGTGQFMNSLFAAGIGFMDKLNSNTQVGAIGGSNDELLINNVGSKNLRLQTLTGGDIKFQPGSGGKVTLNDGSDDLFTFYLNSGVPRLEWAPDELTNVGFINMNHTNIGGGDIGTVSIQPPYDAGQAELTLKNAASGDGGSTMSWDGDIFRVTKIGDTNFAKVDFDDRINIEPDGSGSNPALTIGNPNVGFWHTGTGELRVRTTGGTSPVMRWRGDGFVFLHFDHTTGSAANTHKRSTDGVIRRSTSSLRYKPGWQFADEDELAKLELPNPITWIERNEDELEGTIEQDIFLGFGTEHIEAMLPAAVQDRDGDGRPDNYDVRSLVAILSAKVKRLEAMVGVA